VILGKATFRVEGNSLLHWDDLPNPPKSRLNLPARRGSKSEYPRKNLMAGNASGRRGGQTHARNYLFKMRKGGSPTQSRDSMIRVDLDTWIQGRIKGKQRNRWRRDLHNKGEI